MATVRSLSLLTIGLACFVVFALSAEIPIGNWVYNAHGTKAGACTLLNDRQIRIQGFNYDGKGPEAWFMADINPEPKNPEPMPCCNYRMKNESIILGDDQGQCHHKPEPYTDKEITLTLPPPLTWRSVDFIGLYCYKFGHLFGYVQIPKEAKEMAMDSYQGMEDVMALDDCVKQQDRILADEPMLVTCTRDAPANTSAGNFP